MQKKLTSLNENNSKEMNKQTLNTVSYFWRVTYSHMFNVCDGVLYAKGGDNNKLITKKWEKKRV